MTEVQDTEKQAKEDDIVALLRLFQYARLEAQRLGLPETTRLIDLPATSCLQEAHEAFGLRLFEEDPKAEEIGRARH
jgi:hypothetical protein